MRRKVQFNLVIGILSASICPAVCQGQYRVLPGKTDAGEFGDCSPMTAARICLGATGTAYCYTPPNDENSIFGLEPKAKTVGRLNGQDLTLFSSVSSGCGSGTLTNFALLVVRNGEFVNLLPKVRLTNQSEYKFWNLPRFSNLPVLVTADFVWDFKAEETHFAPHRYVVNAYALDTKSGQYIQRARYVTAKKYPGLDDSDSIQVLDAEKVTILAKLRQGTSD